MAGEFQVARILGIPIKVHWTLILFIPVLAFLLANQLPEVAQQAWFQETFDTDPSVLSTQEAQLFAGFVVAIGLFVSVLLHELGHAVVALRHGIGVKQITLWIFGGIAMLEGITKDPKAEAKIAIAGPIVSFALGAMPAAFILFDPGPYVTFVVAYLAVLNIVLALFNLLPAFPLDGGRLLRAVLAMRMSFGRATKIAADIGKVMAVLLGLLGLFSSIWLMLIALFIYMGASQEAEGVQLFDALDHIEVREIMDTRVPAVTSETYIEELVPLMLSTRTTGFPVIDGGDVLGVVTLTDIQGIEESNRSLVRAGDVMSRDLVTVRPDTKASEALKRMMDRDIGRLLVIEDERLVGVVTRAGIMQAFQILKVVPQVEPAEVADVSEADRLDESGEPQLR